MIPSFRIQALHEMFSNVSAAEWALFFCGALAGTLVWVLVYKRLLHRFIFFLKNIFRNEVFHMLIQAGIGVVIIAPNVILVNLGEVFRNFIVAAFGISGILFGLWVFIPEEQR